MLNGLNHFDAGGKAVMVDVTGKAVTQRVAVAQGEIHVNAPVMEAIVNGTAKKGDVLGVARVAGIMAVKRSSDLIPMCHPLPITGCSLDLNASPDEGKVTATCTVKVTGNTGVEMEALTGVSVALLTVYDMCKALDRGMTITDVHLLRKEGGKSGTYVNESPEPEKKPIICAVSGLKNAGKTTLMVKLIHALTRRGLQVAAIKHDGHDFEPDVPETDSWRYGQAGACGYAVYSPERYMLVRKTRAGERDFLDAFPDADVILLEGFKDSAYPKIEVLRKDAAAVPLPVCDPATMLALCTDLPLKLPGVPTVGLDDAEALADLILLSTFPREGG